MPPWNFYFRGISGMSGESPCVCTCMCEMMFSGQDAGRRSDYVLWMENPCKLDLLISTICQPLALILILSFQVAPRHGSWHALDSAAATSSLHVLMREVVDAEEPRALQRCTGGRQEKPEAEPYDPLEWGLFTCRVSGDAACAPTRRWVYVCVSGGKLIFKFQISLKYGKMCFRM